MFLYTNFDVFTFDLFLFTFYLKYPNNLHLKNAYFTDILTFNIQNWVAIGMAMVRSGLSAVSK